MSIRTRVVAAMTAAILGGAAVVAAAPAVGAEEQVADLVVVAEVAADTSLTVSETIRYDFGNTIQRGIYRDIPVAEELATGDVRHYGVDVLSVRMDGASVPYELVLEDGNLRVRIGDPEGAVMDVREYEVVYRVTGSLLPPAPEAGAAGVVELYWNLVGTGWQVPIARAEARVTGPADAVAVACYAGYYGSGTPCTTAVTRATVVLGPVMLVPGEALTGAVSWPAAAFTQPIVQDVREGPTASAIRGALIGAGAGLVVIAVIVGLAIALRRRDAGAPAGAPLTYSPPGDSRRRRWRPRSPARASPRRRSWPRCWTWPRADGCTWMSTARTSSDCAA